MSEKIDISLLSPEQIREIIVKQNEEMRRIKEQKQRELEKMQKEIEKLKKVSELQSGVINKLRMPGIDESELPSNEEIANAIGMDVQVLDNLLDKNPLQYLSTVEQKISAQVSMLKVELTDNEVDITGESIIELIENVIVDFFDKYQTSVMIDENFPEALKTAKEKMIRLKEQYYTYKNYLHRLALLMDCRLSAYIHFRKVVKPEEELVQEMPETEDKESIKQLKEMIGEMKAELDELKKKSSEIEDTVAQEEQNKSQEAILNEMDKVNPPPSDDEDDTNTTDVDDEENKPKKKTKGKSKSKNKGYRY